MEIHDDTVYQFGDARLTMRNLKEAAAYALVSVAGEATASISGLSASGKKIIARWLKDEFRVTGSEDRARLLTMLADVIYYPCHEFSNANPRRTDCNLTDRGTPSFNLTVPGK